MILSAVHQLCEGTKQALDAESSHLDELPWPSRCLSVQRTIGHGSKKETDPRILTFHISIMFGMISNQASGIPEALLVLRVCFKELWNDAECLV